MQPRRPYRMPQARREREAKKKYEQNASGAYSKVRAVCDWDFASDGNLKEFDSVRTFLEHEEACHERRRRGEHPAKYETLSAEQQALASAVNTQADEQADETRAVVRESKEEIVQELQALSAKCERGWESERGSRAAGEARLIVFELVHDSLSKDEIRQLLGRKGMENNGRKAALAKTAAMCTTLAEVQEFLSCSGRVAGAGKVSAAEAASKKKRARREALTQTTLPVMAKRCRTEEGRPQQQNAN